jgi:hypothetical protein
MGGPEYQRDDSNREQERRVMVCGRRLRKDGHVDSLPRSAGDLCLSGSMALNMWTLYRIIAVLVDLYVATQYPSAQPIPQG